MLEWPPQKKGRISRWSAAQESTFALASRYEKFDSDAIIVYLLSGRFKLYRNVTPSKVVQIFQENKPSCTTDLAGLFKHTTEDYFRRRSNGQIKANGELILVITNGEPDHSKGVMKVIMETS